MINIILYFLTSQNIKILNYSCILLSTEYSLFQLSVFSIWVYYYLSCKSSRCNSVNSVKGCEDLRFYLTCKLTISLLGIVDTARRQTQGSWDRREGIISHITEGSVSINMFASVYLVSKFLGCVHRSPKDACTQWVVLQERNPSCKYTCPLLKRETLCVSSKAIGCTYIFEKTVP